jgi:hypothetical protein
VHRYRLDPAQCLYVGVGPHDVGFARRVGFKFSDACNLLSGEGSSFSATSC